MPAKRRTQQDRREERTDPRVCPAVKSITKVGNELRLIVIRYLLERPMRFNELLATVRTIDPKSLSRVLKYLVTEGIVQRDVLGTQPFAVQYSLTEKGLELNPVIQSLQLWGQRWLMSAPEARSLDLTTRGPGHRDAPSGLASSSAISATLRNPRTAPATG